jgi:hypothetical protein
MAPYKAAILYSTLARSYVRDLRGIAASGVSEKGGGKGRWYANGTPIYVVSLLIYTTLRSEYLRQRETW